MEFPTRGDWVYTVQKDLKEFGIEENFEEIKLMSKNKFGNILKDKGKTRALKYLIEKQGTKGKDISYSCIQMSEYLHPSNKLTIEEKRKQFEIRNKMVDIPANFPKTEVDAFCFCGSPEDLKHIYECEIYESEKHTKEYEKIYNGNIFEQTEVYRRMEKCLEKRILFLEEFPLPWIQLRSAANCSFG